MQLVQKEERARFSRPEIAGLRSGMRNKRADSLHHIQRHRLVPLEVPAGQEHRADLLLPVSVSARRLFDDIVGECFFTTLENATIQSLFSENWARFRSTEAAHQNIHKSDELTRLIRTLSQEGGDDRDGI
jgi:F0F1-type ATP synthase gamma subunit